MSRLPLWNFAFLFLPIVLLDAQSYIGSGSSVPINGITDEVCLQNINSIVADNRSLCWYYLCHPSPSGNKLIPRRCSLGTHLSPGYTVNTYNPCTQNFPIMDMYDCTRTANASVPDCKTKPNCTNGGKFMQQDDKCWCECPPQWQGSPDCSKAKGTTPRPQPFTDCPRFNWCASSTLKEPCLNGGTCVNQCTNFICNCTVPYTKTKYCDEFDCATTNFTCPDANQTCTRGLNGKDEFYVCRNNKCADYLKHWR